MQTLKEVEPIIEAKYSGPKVASVRMQQQAATVPWHLRCWQAELPALSGPSVHTAVPSYMPRLQATTSGAPVAAVNELLHEASRGGRGRAAGSCPLPGPPARRPLRVLNSSAAQAPSWAAHHADLS